MAKPISVSVDPQPPVKVPEPESTLPTGVQMHDVKRQANSGGPPAGWKGTYQSCGVCGLMVANGQCFTCAPAHAQPSVLQAMPTKVA